MTNDDRTDDNTRKPEKGEERKGEAMGAKKKKEQVKIRKKKGSPKNNTSSLPRVRDTILLTRVG